MTTIRSVARWGSLIVMIVGAAVSVGVSAVMTACGGKSETGEKQIGGRDAGTDAAKDAQTDADGASDVSEPLLDVGIPDQQVGDIIPSDDVSLDTVPAE